MPVVGCHWDTRCVVVGDTRCSFLRRQARQQRGRRQVGAWLVEVLVALSAQKPVALRRTLCPEVLVLLFVAPLLYAKGAAVPCARFWRDWTMTLVAVVF